MMTQVRAGLLALAAVAALAIPAAAQGRFQGGLGGRGGGLMLLVRPEVQAELKLTDAQKAKVAELSQKMRDDFQGLAGRLQNATPEQRRQLLAQLQADRQKAVDEVLNPEQQKRFRQISLQQQGLAAALADPAVASELKLTEAQQAKVREALEARQRAMAALFQGGAGPEVREKLAALQKQTDDQLLVVLTDDQKTRWREMLGTPLNLPPARFGR